MRLARFFIARGGEVEVALPLGGDAEREQCPRLTEGIAVRPCQSETLFAQRGRSCEIAAHLSERRCREERIDASFGRDSAAGRQRGLEPLLTLARFTAGVGEGEDRPSQPQHRGGIAGAQGPGDGRVQVVPLDRQSLDPGRRTRGDEMRLGLLRQGQVISRMGRAGRVLFPAGGESLQSELSNRLEHAVAGLAGRRLGLDQQALLDEPADPVQDIAINLTCSGRDGRDSFQAAAAGQHG